MCVPIWIVQGHADALFSDHNTHAVPLPFSVTISAVVDDDDDGNGDGKFVTMAKLFAKMMRKKNGKNKAEKNKPQNC